MDIGEIERLFRDKGIVAFNMHFHGGKFRLQVKRSDSDGFRCAQRDHATFEAAVLEHFPEEMELLV